VNRQLANSPEGTGPFRGMVAALGAALLFGLGTPAAKILVPSAEPLMLGGVLYLGAGLGLSLIRVAGGKQTQEAALRLADLPLLLGITAAGAVVAPVLLLVGLRRVSAVTASLALNLEGPLTVVLAVLLFGEQLSARAAVGTFLIMVGAALLGFTPGDALGGDALGVLCVVGACCGWALDNNLTSRLSLRDPVAIVQTKGLVGGAFSVGLALLIGHEVPPIATLGWGLLLGLVSYGASVVLAVYAMRLIGVAREATFFATAPFIGALVSVAFLGEQVGPRELGATLVMLAGISLLVREQHAHAHVHEPLEHDHRHVHDVHHQHAAVPGPPPGEPHAHQHTHSALEHEHPHAPDIHHRHH
jgi:drug/metabolite transporter (DMT)-like permease